MLATVPRVLVLLGWLAATAPAADDRRSDILVADFEGSTYGVGWQVEGTAFGSGPAPGALPGQMSVAGFEGHGLVNSFAGGDDATGSLISPPFPIDRRFVNFLVGGGKYPGETCVDLLINGQTVRTATGPNDAPGGSERLDWLTWDVAEFAGQTATLRVVDHRRGGWGHINVDQVTLSDTRRQAEPVTRTIVANSRYLNLPVRVKNPIRRVQIRQRDQVVREFDIRLDDGPGNILVGARDDNRGPIALPPYLTTGINGPARAIEHSADGQIVRRLDGRPVDGTADFMTWLDLAPFKGQTLTITTTPPGTSHSLDGLTLSDQVAGSATMYTERDRPLFHFTNRRGWLNDPNGLVWHEGTYHLFYQHNPYGWDWGNMHWGHATSPDLVRWTEQPIALYPRKYGDWAFSGSAVVDRQNTSGFGTDGKAPLVAAYTSTGRGECIVSSTDGGQTWTEFAGNPVVRHDGRDPRLVWHEPTQRWIMAVYDEADKKQAIVFHSSPDLKVWTEESRIDGFFECPDLFELPIQGAEPARSLWVLSAADGKYRLGQFDGHRFTPETAKLTLWHGDFYAAQTYSNTPDGRRIQIGWARDISFPGMPFNQQMAVPVELTLRTTTEGPRLFAEPVPELSHLLGPSNEQHGWFGGGEDRSGGQELALQPVQSGFDIRITLRSDEPGGLVVTWLGSEIWYDGARQVLTVAGLEVALSAVPGQLQAQSPTHGLGVGPNPLTLGDREIKLRILGDRRSLEVFANDGQVAVSRRINPDHQGPRLKVTTRPDPQHPQLLDFQLHQLRSAWRPDR